MALMLKSEARDDAANLYLLQGELLLQTQARDPQSAEEAEACFHKAIEIARQQQAKSLELRASTSLARLWQQQALGQRAKSKGVRVKNGNQESRSTQYTTRNTLKDAHDLLAEIYHWFTEGFDTKDLQAAKALLDMLRNH